MAMQMRGADPRLYNPDRDMIWAMPRLMSKTLKRFGEDITAGDIRKMLSVRSIEVDCDDDELLAALGTIIRDFARYLNDLKDNMNVRREPADRYNAIFVPAPPNKVYEALRALIGDFFISIVYAELPFWFDSVQPENANNPAPTVEEVTHTVDLLLASRESGNQKQRGTSDE